MSRAVAPALVAAAALLGACGGDGAAGDGGREPVVVAAAASLERPLTACSRAFEDADVRLSFAGSDELATQIRQGVAPDVFAAADAELPERLAEEGLLAEPVAFAANRLVVAVPDASPITGVDDLADPGVRVVVGSASAPVGRYAREALGRLDRDLEEAILDNVRSEEPSVSGVVGKLSQSAADAGLVYATDVEAAPGVRAIALPDRLQPEIRYAAATAPHAGDGARGYVEDLRGGRCADALRAAGFAAPPER